MSIIPIYNKNNYNLNVHYKDYKESIKHKKMTDPSTSFGNNGDGYQKDYYDILYYINTILVNSIESNPKTKFNILTLEDEKQIDELTKLLQKRHILNLFLDDFHHTDHALPLKVNNIKYDLLITGFRKNPKDIDSKRALGLIAIKQGNENEHLYKKFKTVLLYTSAKNKEYKYYQNLYKYDNVKIIQDQMDLFLNFDDIYYNKNYTNEEEEENINENKKSKKDKKKKLK